MEKRINTLDVIVSETGNVVSAFVIRIKGDEILHFQ
jgi:hypothetical protein